MPGAGAVHRIKSTIRALTSARRDWAESGHPGGEIGADVVRRSDFESRHAQIGVHRQHTRSDHPCLRVVAIGPMRKSLLDRQTSASEPVDDVWASRG